MSMSVTEFPYVIYDAHHHFWNLDQVYYPWLATKGIVRFFGDPAPIQKNYLPSNLIADADYLQVKKSVHIQVGADDGQHLKEAQVVQRICEQHGLGNAIVAFAELESTDLNNQLDALQTVERVRGVRQIVGRSPEEDKQTGTGALIDNPSWLTGLQELSHRKLSFDLQLIPEQMQKVADVLAHAPDLNIALCHCGSPWYRENTNPKGWQTWRDGLAKLAENSNVFCKVSGLSMFDHNWTPATLKPIIDHVLACFGSERVMFGSNFPVDKLHTGYTRLWQAYLSILENHEAGFNTHQIQAMFANNCASFYRI